jgi:hypothetical protein
VPSGWYAAMPVVVDCLLVLFVCLFACFCVPCDMFSDWFS